jgi:2-polyprenyl-3-methyl-5-hydroxy-6-metoxy-1,4-benzoquinol methylase
MQLNATCYKYEIRSIDETTHYGRLLTRVGTRQEVLELRTSTGYLSEMMTKELSRRVYGIEIDPMAVQKARAKCTDVRVADLYVADITELYRNKHFYVALCSDVLEYLRNPERTLNQVKQLLNPDGYIIASNPNISHGNIRLALIFGRFPYRSMGLLDDTHVRFFTRQLVEEVFDQAGFKLESVERNRWNTFTTEVTYSLRHVSFFDTYSQSLAVDLESETYQFIVRASIKPENVQHNKKAEQKNRELIVVVRPGAPIDELYRNYLSRLNYPAERLSLTLLSGSLEEERFTPAGSSSKLYADHGFRTYRFLRKGVRDESLSHIARNTGAQLIEKGLGEELRRGLYRALELASANKPECLAILLSITLPELKTLNSFLENVRKNEIRFARPEVLADEEATLLPEGKVSWQIPSLFVFSRKTAKRCLDAWTERTFKTIRAQSANFFFSLLKQGIQLNSSDAGCYRFCPILDDSRRLALANGVKLRNKWGGSRHKLSYFKNCVLPAYLPPAKKGKLFLVVAAKHLSGADVYGGSQGLITFGGFGASTIGARKQSSDNSNKG